MDNEFIFSSPEIDGHYLSALYEGDADILKSVFLEFLSSLQEAITRIENSFNTGNQLEYKTVLHKYKSSFGYVGLTGTLQYMQELEDKTVFVSNTNDLAGEHQKLMEQIKPSAVIIANELSRMK
jgi:hypothetical protein